MLTSRPPLTDKLVVRVARPWTPGGRYEVEIKGVRNTTGTTGDVRGGGGGLYSGAPWMVNVESIIV